MSAKVGNVDKYPLNLFHHWFLLIAYWNTAAMLCVAAC